MIACTLITAHTPYPHNAKPEPPTSSTHLHVITELTVLKEVYGELDVLGLLRHAASPLLAGVPPEHSQGAGGLEARLQPELCAGAGVGHVDTQAAVLAQDDEGGATQGDLQVGGTSQ